MRLAHETAAESDFSKVCSALLTASLNNEMCLLQPYFVQDLPESRAVILKYLVQIAD